MTDPVKPIPDWVLPTRPERLPWWARPAKSREEQLEVFPNLTWAEADPIPVGRRVFADGHTGTVAGCTADPESASLYWWWILQDDAGRLWAVYPPTARPLENP